MEQTELNLILEQHQLWLDGKGGVCAKLKGASLNGANLSGASLTRADLYCANLTRANLTGANLYRANLTGADLNYANLTYANLSYADLTHANLQGANLRGADLTGANLTGANLTHANLYDANLTNAILPDISWIIPGCLIRLNQINYDFYLEKERKWEDSFGFFIQDNPIEKTFDMLVEDRIIRNIPDWLKYSGLKQVL